LTDCNFFYLLQLVIAFSSSYHHVLQIDLWNEVFPVVGQ